MRALLIKSWWFKNWIYRSSYDAEYGVGGIISIVYNQYIYTLWSKNLWADYDFIPWTSPLTKQYCWYLYQRWNNYWFDWFWTFNTDISQVDTTWYWPWNYYNDGTFRSWAYWDWSSPSNDNLWWSYVWTVEAMQWPCPTWYHVPSLDEFNNIQSILVQLYWYSDWMAWFYKYLRMPLAWMIYEWNAIRIWNEWHYRCATPVIWWDSAYWLYIISNMNTIPWSKRKFWYSIRPFRNVPIMPDEYWTKIG